MGSGNQIVAMVLMMSMIRSMVVGDEDYEKIVTGMSSTSAQVDEVPLFPMNAQHRSCSSMRLYAHLLCLLEWQLRKDPIALGGGIGQILGCLQQQVFCLQNILLKFILSSIVIYQSLVGLVVDQWAQTNQTICVKETLERN